jgi:predicted aldo/keto reductase-like oxidoreductase
MQFNDLFCLAAPQVHTLSIGAAKPEDFDEHIQALQYYDRATVIAQEIAQRLDKELERVLGSDWVRSWHEGIPSFESVPGQINVFEILRLWTYAKGLGMVEWAKTRYNLLGQGGHWFPGKNAAEIESYNLKECLKHNKFADQIPTILKEAHALLADSPVKRLSSA